MVQQLDRTLALPALGMNQGDHQDQAKVFPLTDTLLLPCRRGDGDKISTVLIEYSYLKSNPELCLFDKKSNSMV